MDDDSNRLCVRIGSADKWITGLTKRTTCDDVIYALLKHTKKDGDDLWSYSMYERWRGVERQLSGRTKILKVWRAWGDQRHSVKLYVRKKSSCSSSKRHKRRQPLQVHRVVGRIIEQEKQIQDQMERLERLDSQIDKYETRSHLKRMQEDGNNYVQNSYWRSSSSSSDERVDCLFPCIKSADLQAYERMCDSLIKLQKQIDNEQSKFETLATSVLDENLHYQLEKCCNLNNEQTRQLDDIELNLSFYSEELCRKKDFLKILEEELERDNKSADNDSDTGLSSLHSDAETTPNIRPLLETLV